jgi:hypothetical protein
MKLCNPRQRENLHFVLLRARAATAEGVYVLCGGGGGGHSVIVQ